MSESGYKDEHAGRGGERPDADGDEFTSSDGPESPPEEQDPVHAAELQLIDALLLSMSRQAVDDRNARIRRVMDAVEESPTVPGKRTRSRLWQSLVAVAASLTVVCTLSWLEFSRESRASDVLLEIAGVSLERIDRVYSVRRIVSTTGKPDQPEGRLYLRGCDGFVIVCGGVVLGRNTDEFWFVPQDGPVVVAEDFEWIVGTSEREQLELELLNVLSVDSRSLPLVQLSSAVELMRQDYEVRLDDRTRHGRRVDLLVGELKNENWDLPRERQEMALTVDCEIAFLATGYEYRDPDTFAVTRQSFSMETAGRIKLDADNIFSEEEGWMDYDWENEKIYMDTYSIEYGSYTMNFGWDCHSELDSVYSPALESQPPSSSSACGRSQ